MEEIPLPRQMKCLVLGANGQDGSFLVEQLAAGGADVEGWGRQESYRYAPPPGKLRYRQVDLRDGAAVREGIEAFAPVEIYCVAATHGSAGFSYEPVWDAALDVNTKSLYYALEYARNSAVPVRIFYASSAKVFGDPLPEDISMATPRRNQCLYSITKNASENLIQYYRDRHGLQVSVGILFNHESNRRSSAYFLPKMCAGVALAVRDPETTTEFRTLDFFCDWGSAEEFMSLAIRSLRAGKPSTCLMATGKTYRAGDLVARVYEDFGLDYRDHVKCGTAGEAGRFYRVEIDSMVESIGAAPGIDALELCRRMVSEQLAGHDR